jgi:hypothetical protein
VTEPSTEWPAVHTAITELAAILAGARAALGGAGRAGNQLEMAEMDLLSARSAVENACWELDFEPPTAGDVSRSVQPARPVRVPDGAEQPDPRRSRRPGRRAPGQGQCELFSLPATHDERGPAHGTRKGVGCRDRDVDASGQR